MSLPSEQPHETGSSPLAAEPQPALDGEFTSSLEEPTRLPVPSGPLRTQFSDSQPRRPSFWKRFKMRARGESAADSGTDTLSASDLSTRLDAIEQAVEHFDTTLETQLEAVNARLEDVWESEEQLSHLADIQDKLDKLALAQAKHAASIDGMRRTQTWLATLVVVAAVAIGFLASQIL